MPPSEAARASSRTRRGRRSISRSGTAATRVVGVAVEHERVEAGERRVGAEAALVPDARRPAAGRPARRRRRRRPRGCGRGSRPAGRRVRRDALDLHAPGSRRRSRLSPTSMRRAPPRARAVLTKRSSRARKAGRRAKSLSSVLSGSVVDQHGAAAERSAEQEAARRPSSARGRRRRRRPRGRSRRGRAGRGRPSPRPRRRRQRRGGRVEPGRGRGPPADHAGHERVEARPERRRGGARAEREQEHAAALATHAASVRRTSGVKPGTSSTMSAAHAGSSSSACSGTAGSGCTCASSSSAASACSMGGGPPVATCVARRPPPPPSAARRPRRPPAPRRPRRCASLPVSAAVSASGARGASRRGSIRQIDLDLRRPHVRPERRRGRAPCRPRGSRPSAPPRPRRSSRPALAAGAAPPPSPTQPAARCAEPAHTTRTHTRVPDAVRARHPRSRARVGRRAPAAEPRRAIVAVAAEGGGASGGDPSARSLKSTTRLSRWARPRSRPFASATAPSRSVARSEGSRPSSVAFDGGHVGGGPEDHARRRAGEDDGHLVAGGQAVGRAPARRRARGPSASSPPGSLALHAQRVVEHDRQRHRGARAAGEGEARAVDEGRRAEQRERDHREARAGRRGRGPPAGSASARRAASAGRGARAGRPAPPPCGGGGGGRRRAPTTRSATRSADAVRKLIGAPPPTASRIGAHHLRRVVRSWWRRGSARRAP